MPARSFTDIPTSLSTLPEDLIRNHIAPHLKAAADVRNLSQTSRALYTGTQLRRAEIDALKRDLEESPELYKTLEPEERGDPELALSALRGVDRQTREQASPLKTFAKFLKRAPQTIRDNKAIVLYAIKRYGPALKYASNELRGDLDVVHEAITARGDASNPGKAILYVASILWDPERLAELFNYMHRAGVETQPAFINLLYPAAGIREHRRWLGGLHKQLTRNTEFIVPFIRATDPGVTFNEGYFSILKERHQGNRSVLDAVTRKTQER